MLCIKQNVNIYKAAIMSDTRRDLMRETYLSVHHRSNGQKKTGKKRKTALEGRFD